MKTENELQAEIKELDFEIQDLEFQLADAKNKRNGLRIELYKLQSGFEVGDKVQFKDGRAIKTGEITSFKINYSGVSPVVTIHKNDGTLGLRTKDYFYRSELTKI